MRVRSGWKRSRYEPSLTTSASRLTGHLSELRARLLLSVAVLAVLFAGCLWQSRSLLHVLNAPLAQLRNSSPTEGAGSELPNALARSAGAFSQLAHASRSIPS